MAAAKAVSNGGYGYGAGVYTPGCKHCGDSVVTQCDYVDEHDIQCDQIRCARHLYAAGSETYCARHIGIVESYDQGQLLSIPDVGDRAASLLNWVRRDIDDDLTWFLYLMGTPNASEIVAWPVQVIPDSLGGRWQATWTLEETVGVTLNVSISVASHEDDLLMIHVGSQMIGRVRPPWIEHDVRREHVSPKQDTIERWNFVVSVLQAIQSAARREYDAAMRLTARAS